MNLVQPLVFIFVALIIVFTLCGNAHAYVSKYGGKFFNMKKNVTLLKKAKVKAFYTCGNVGSLAHHQRASITLCT